MKIELKVELDTEKEKDEALLAQLVALLEGYNDNTFDDEELDKT
jgi:hypothetical protein